jgi:hypothetical protein
LRTPIYRTTTQSQGDALGWFVRLFQSGRREIEDTDLSDDDSIPGRCPGLVCKALSELRWVLDFAIVGALASAGAGRSPAQKVDQ